MIQVLKPGFSVIITNYRHESFLIDAISSALAQTYREFEIIVMNDDPSFNMEQYSIASKEIKITVMNTIRNLGQPAQINNGARIAEREFCAFLDADDTWPQYKLFVQSQFMDYDMTYGDCVLMRDDNSRTYIKALEWDREKALHQQTLATFSSIVVRTGLLRTVPFDEGIGYGNDRVWSIAVSDTGARIHKICLPLFYYRDYTSQYGKFRIKNPIRKLSNLIARIQRKAKQKKLQRYINEWFK